MNPLWWSAFSNLTVDWTLLDNYFLHIFISTMEISNTSNNSFETLECKFNTFRHLMVFIPIWIKLIWCHHWDWRTVQPRRSKVPKLKLTAPESHQDSGFFKPCMKSMLNFFLIQTLSNAHSIDSIGIYNLQLFSCHLDVWFYFKSEISTERNRIFPKNIFNWKLMRRFVL